MKPRYISIALLIIIYTLFLVSIVHAPWSTLGTGYAITSNYHGIDVLLGTPVTVTAGTLNANVTQITFRWHMPNETTRWEVTVPVYVNGTTGQWNDGTTALIRYANNTQIPDLIGDWGVQAFFQDSSGRDRAELEDVISIRASSFNVIPEIPLGTIGAIVTMLIALAFFTIRKGKTAHPQLQT